jgi:hypothetical protein
MYPSAARGGRARLTRDATSRTLRPMPRASAGRRRARRPPPRYAALPLPAAPWLPGRGPRPTVHVPPGPLDPARWRTCDAWLHAVDLWNAGFWWECHELLEPLWRALPRGAPERELLKGLIQLAAAHVALALGRRAAAERMCARGSARVRRSAGRPLGLAPAALAAASEAWVEGRAATPPRLALRGAGARRRARVTRSSPLEPRAPRRPPASRSR